MTKPSRFIANSDFATFKNDNGTSVSVVFPASTNVTGNGTSTVSADVTIGVTGAVTRVQISSSKDSSLRYAASSLSYTRTGTSSGSPAPYSIIAYVYRTSATNLRCSVYVPNIYGSTLTTASGDETFTFYIDTFIPPFS